MMMRQRGKDYTIEHQTPWTLARGRLCDNYQALAVKHLSEDDRQQVDFSPDDRREALPEILAVVETEKTLIKGREWKLGKRSDGEPIVLRDVLGKIANWIDKLKEVGDNAANFDPVHAALPWAAVRFVLQAVVNETHTYEGMLEGLEKVSSLITRYAMVEDMYLRRSSSSLEGQLSNALIWLYTSILVFLAKSRKYFSRKTGGRIKVSVEEAAIDSLAHLINADYMRKINNSMEGKLAALLDNVGGISGQIEGLQLTQKTSATDLIRDSIIQWIVGVKTYWQDYERALAACVAGTCDWIFQRPEFEDWIGPDESDSAKILWIHGHPGFGKTVLTARMTERLGQARFPQQILRSWVAQLVALSDAAFEMAKEVYATKKHPEATESELWQLFGLVNVKVRNMVFVVDGFDECSTEEQDLGKRAYLPARKRFLKSLEEAIGRTGARVLFNGDLASISWLEHEIAPPDSEYGIHVYAEKVVEERLHTKSIELKKDIARRLTQKSEGMFLYIYRIQARLKSSMSASKLRTMIDDAPRGRDFNEAYERDLQVIASLEDDDKRTGGRHTSVDEDNTMDRCFLIEDLPDEWDQNFVEEQITGLCGSLIDLRGKEAGKPIMDQDVHFLHFTIKEYLERPDRLNFPVSLRNDFLDTVQAHEKIVKACLCHMCYKDFIQTDHSTKPMFDDKLVKYPFLRFTGVSWIFTCLNADPSLLKSSNCAMRGLSPPI
ncbi:MAG: hypothetical protein ASARMPREDX12_005527 [Alectoria sarmentosa]|nr:MAG: hypothetical protein ASARMPREDX12_005527 [Alectoria sarmentosa]